MRSGPCDEVGDYDIYIYNSTSPSESVYVFIELQMWVEMADVKATVYAQLESGNLPNSGWLEELVRAG